MTRRHLWGHKPYQVQGLEPRLLLAGYGLTQIAYMGANSTGITPQSMLVEDAAGNWYGTASSGGTYGAGTVFEIPKGSSTITTLASFNGADGATPIASVTLDAAGNIYGTTENGGGYDDGVVFEIAKGTNTIAPLASFSPAYGIHPTGGLVMDAAGNLYGTAPNGGAYGYGTVYEIPQGGGGMSVVTSFNNGGYPNGSVAFDSSGNLYGIAGSLFVLPRGTHTIQVVAVLDSNTTGSDPNGNLVFDSAGNLYGTCQSGGSNQEGTVYELAKGSNAITLMAPFPSGGQAAAGLTLDAAGNIYCASQGGGSAGVGAVFELAKGSGVLTTLASFNSTNGANPRASVAVDAAGNLFGTASGGGANSTGTVFELAKGSGTIMPLATAGPINGADPGGPLAMDSAGNLYGATSAGGQPYDYSTIFEIAKGSGAATPIAVLPYTSEGIDSGLKMDSTGNLYGTTSSSSSGTVFER